MSAEQSFLFDTAPVATAVPRPVRRKAKPTAAKPISAKPISAKPCQTSPTTEPPNTRPTAADSRADDSRADDSPATNPPATNPPAANPPAANPTLDQLRKMTGCILQRTADSVAATPRPTAGSTPGRSDTHQKPNAAPEDEPTYLSSGSPAIDAMLPATGRWRGLATAGITQYVSTGGGDVVGSPAGTLALAAANWWLHPSEPRRHAALRDGYCRTGPIVIVARRDQFFPPAAVSMGIDRDRIIWVRPRSRGDAVWSIDQSLRCPHVSAVWSVLDERLDDRDSRRIQLAAEEGRTPGFLVRPPRAADRRATFAQVSLSVSLVPVSAEMAATAAVLEGRARPVEFDPADPDAIYRRGKPFRTALPNLNHPILRVTVDRARGRVGGQSTLVQIDDAGRIVSLAPQISQLANQFLDRHDPRSSPRSNGRSPDRSHCSASGSAAAVRLAAQLADPKTTSPEPAGIANRSGTAGRRAAAG